MSTRDGRGGLWRSRWAAIGAAVAITFGAGGLVAVNAAGGVDSTTVMIDPQRVLDSRDPTNLGLAGPFASRVPQKLQITGLIQLFQCVPSKPGWCPGTVVPTGATGVVLNVTEVNASADGFISIRPGDATGLPSTSSLNFKTGQVVPNAVLVALPTAGANAGKIDIVYDAYGWVGPTTDILIDVVGYTTASTLNSLQAQIDDKAPRLKTFTRSGFEGTALGTVTLAGSNGCAYNAGSSSGLRVFMPIPVGASIVNVTATMYDAPGTAQYSVTLERHFTTATGDSWTVIASDVGGQFTNETVTKGLTPPIAETVDPYERFAVLLDQSSGVMNGLCSVSITYEEAATA